MKRQFSCGTTKCSLQPSGWRPLPYHSVSIQNVDGMMLRDSSIITESPCGAATLQKPRTFQRLESFFWVSCFYKNPEASITKTKKKKKKEKERYQCVLVLQILQKKWSLQFQQYWNDWPSIWKCASLHNPQCTFSFKKGGKSTTSILKRSGYIVKYYCLPWWWWC